MDKDDFYNEKDAWDAEARCTCSTCSNPPCWFCTTVKEEEDPKCYCLECDWQGVESDLNSHEKTVTNGIVEFAQCPSCESIHIVFIE